MGTATCGRPAEHTGAKLTRVFIMRGLVCTFMSSDCLGRVQMLLRDVAVGMAMEVINKVALLQL